MDQSLAPESQIEAHPFLNINAIQQGVQYCLRIRSPVTSDLAGCNQRISLII